jgi:predicted ester cyclase
MSAPLCPSDVARAWFEQVWNQREHSAIDRMLSPEAGIDSLHFEDMTVLRGPAQFKPFHQAMLSAIPNLHITISKIIEQGDWVSVRFVCEGTHTGPGLGFEPNGNRVQFSAIAMGRVENGQWVKGWNVVDFFALQKQANGEMRISRVE